MKHSSHSLMELIRREVLDFQQYCTSNQRSVVASHLFQLADRLATGLELPEPKPTDKEPGSDEKINLLRERAANGVALWSPRDEQEIKTPTAKHEQRPGRPKNTRKELPT